MKIALIAEYDPGFEPHVQTDAALKHSSTALGLNVDAEWVSTSSDRLSDIASFDAVWFAPGSPYHDLSRTLEAIRYVREHGVPALGTCGGFQHMVIEFARNVLGITDAQHAEYDPYASRLIVSQLTCSLAGREMEVVLAASSRAAVCYGRNSTIERYYCNFGVNPDYEALLSSGGLEIVGRDDDGECRIMEIPDHPFFVGTLFVPQAGSRPGRPHPLINAFLNAAT